MMRRFARLMLLCAVLLCPTIGHAQDADPFAGLTASSFDEIKQGVDTLAASGNKRALIVLQALDANTLYTLRDQTDDKPLYIMKDDSSFVDARTGAAVTVDPDDVHTVRLNNDVRGELEAVIGSLQLGSTDAATRAAAADAVFQAHDQAALPALNKAIGQETNPSIKIAMEQARAAILLSSTDASEADRLAAVKIWRRGAMTRRAVCSAASAASLPPWRKRRPTQLPRSILTRSSGAWRRACSTA